MQGSEVTVFVDGEQIAGLFENGELSGAQPEVELLVSTEGAVTKNRKPAKVKGIVTSALQAPVNTTWELAASANANVHVGPPRQGLFVGVALTLSPGEKLRVTGVDFNQEDILARKALSGVDSGTGVTVIDGILLEGGNAEPQRFFFFLDKKDRKPITMTATDKVNFQLTNPLNSLVDVPVQLCTSIPRNVVISN